jgi:hypothetical protein
VCLVCHQQNAYLTNDDSLQLKGGCDQLPFLKVCHFVEVDYICSGAGTLQGSWLCAVFATEEVTARATFEGHAQFQAEAFFKSNQTHFFDVLSLLTGCFFVLTTNYSTRYLTNSASESTFRA